MGRVAFLPFNKLYSRVTPRKEMKKDVCLFEVRCWCCFCVVAVVSCLLTMVVLVLMVMVLVLVLAVGAGVGVGRHVCGGSW